MISAMPAVAIRRGRKRSKTFTRFSFPPSRHSSTSSLNRNNRGSFSKRGSKGGITTISGGHYYGDIREFRSRRHPDLDLDRQRRRFLVYLGTLFLITGLLLVFIGVGAAIPTAQTIGLLLIGIGALLCIIKVFCSEAQTEAQVAQKVVAKDVDVESGDGENSSAAPADDVNTPLADIKEFTEPAAAAADEQQATSNGHQNSLSPTSPPNSIPETQVLIGNDAQKY